MTSDRKEYNIHSYIHLRSSIASEYHEPFMNIISLGYSLQAMTKYPSLLYTSKLQIHLLHTTKNYFGHLTKIYCEKQVMYLSIVQRKNVFAISFLFLQQERFATSSMVIKVFELSVIVFETTLSYFCRISILPY